MKYAIASLRLSIEDEGGPYYQQLISQIQQGIASGELAVGDKLPSSRLLATSLGVSRSTTSRAYDQLIAEGILVSELKRGVFVAPQLAYRAERKVPRRETSTLSNKNHLAPSHKSQYVTFDAGVDVEVFPSKEWAASMRRSWLKPDYHVMQGGYLTGYPPLKTALVDYLYRVRGLDCCAEQIIITAGNRDSLQLLQHALSSIDGGAVNWWLEEPTYPPIWQAFGQHSNIQSIATDHEGPCLVEPIQGENVAILTPNRQYPLGTSISSQRRQKWLQTLQEESSPWWVIEDDYDNEFVYQGRMEVPFMQSAQAHEASRNKVFFVGSFSKVLFRGLRLGFIVAPMAHVTLLEQIQSRIGMSASLPMQPVVADFLIQGNFDRHLNRMRRHYRLKRDMLLALLSEYLSAWFDWKKPRGGMHVLIEFKPEWRRPQNGQQALDCIVAERLQQDSISLSPLSLHYRHVMNAKVGFVLGFSGIDESTMKHLLITMRSVLLKMFKNAS
ncbi:PLP-dependent aminotransferase family protein [Marinomonas posidonica]|uniref:Transcriptional regulator, GntR family n=1 Tax=Marinomonas posidonica (strain CECT 7376 / NCIMB 14433 / IVIA-Po-181) TaxID=491952 RepID=F6CZ09_MARPP|nr:PLP-dependent aminotransferase family protein [Marinomonas posidonica]AEF53136.1 transcriptional regulator, GntR family [Marinomonas posidonica IVIA-Po-181]